MPTDPTEYPTENDLLVWGAVHDIRAEWLQDRAEADRLLRATASWLELVRLHDVNPLDYPDRLDFAEFLRPKAIRKVVKGKLVAYRLMLVDNDNIFTWDVVWGPAGVPEGRHNRMTALSLEYGLNLTGPTDPSIFITALRELAQQRAVESET